MRKDNGKRTGMQKLLGVERLGSYVIHFPELGRKLGSQNAAVVLEYLLGWEGKQKNKDRWIFKTIKEFELETMPDIEPIGWHALRHSFASELIRRGASVYSVKDLLRHQSVEVTMRLRAPEPGYPRRQRASAGTPERNVNLASTIAPCEGRGFASTRLKLLSNNRKSRAESRPSLWLRGWGSNPRPRDYTCLYVSVKGGLYLSRKTAG